MVFLSVNDLGVKYSTFEKKVQALDHVSFSLQENESIGIAGESGSGKSTLGLAIMRSLDSNTDVSGKIIFEDKSTLTMTDDEFTRNLRWKKISMIFQGAMNSLDPVFTIKSQIEEILKMHEFKGNYQEKIESIIQSVGLDLSVLNKFPHEISGGMKQRVGIAMALLLSPRLIIADEPTTALDVLVQAQIMSLLKKLKKDGLSIVLISHDLGILSEIVEKIAIMYGGQIVEFGDLAQVYTNPKHPYTISLLESIPKINKPDKIILCKENDVNLSNQKTGCKFYDRCPHAMEKCKMEPPKFKTESGFVMCWLNE